MGRLSEILKNGQADRLRSSWERTQAAGEFAPLPPGEYVAHVVEGELVNGTSKGTPSYKLSFRVCEGEYSGRRFWQDCWLTEAAMPQTKRDLLKLGVTSLDQLERPLPKGFRCLVKLSLRKSDDGAEFNRVKQFEVVGVDTPEPEPFAPTDNDAAAGDSEAQADSVSP